MRGNKNLGGRNAMSIVRPYLMFLGDAADQLAAKTAQGVKDWRPDWCVGQLRLAGCNADLKLPDMTVEQAAAAGVKTVIVGVANRGGVIGESWITPLKRALELGLDLASGLHKRLVDVPAVAEAAKKHGRQLFDFRHPTRDFAVGTGRSAAASACSPSAPTARSARCARPSRSRRRCGRAVSRPISRHRPDRHLHRRRRRLHRRGGVGLRLRRVEWLARERAHHWDLVEGGLALPRLLCRRHPRLDSRRPADALVMCHEPRAPSAACHTTSCRTCRPASTPIWRRRA
jgi:uncharacterized NAD-dependent epimerase/dehydratase family protein